MNSKELFTNCAMYCDNLKTVCKSKTNNPPNTIAMMQLQIYYAFILCYSFFHNFSTFQLLLPLICILKLESSTDTQCTLAQLHELCLCVTYQKGQLSVYSLSFGCRVLDSADRSPPVLCVHLMHWPVTERAIRPWPALATDWKNSPFSPAFY